MFKLYLTLTVVLGVCEAAGPGAGRLVCYLENRVEYVGECTHVVYTGSARGDRLETLLKSYRNNNPRLKIVLRLRDDDKDLQSLLKSKHIQGLEVYEAHKTLNRTKIVETVQSARTAISKNGGGPLFLALPAYPELLAKYYDLRALVKIADLMMVQTHALGLVKKMTYHPSRLSGLWDMMNTDSVVDLAIGLGVPASKIVISLPATARQFTLQNQTLSTPGSPTTDEEPKEISQEDLCRLMTDGRWTLERDQDLSAPYAFKNTTWVSFEDASSVDVKGKYARVRGLAGLALHNADQDLPTPCGPTLKTSLAKVLNSQSRAPRALVLRSLEQEILSSPSAPGRALDALQLSPYRITQVVDSDGVIHSIREDTRTEFSCSRQGYFVHPRSCARFYRCVKFDQLSPEYTVFEFDCPAGLAFDSRYEVCVWPGSLPHSQACPGSSEIAPVPQTRFVCPEHEGYYADPENCRWFFACLDHGKAPLTAYEFRCPFGLGFDAEKLKCDWPWLVPACGNIARYEAEVHGYSGAALTGAAGFYGQTADSVNIAAHQSLVSGAALDNLVGIQTGFLSHADALDGNFIAAQEYANAGVQADAFGTDIGHQGQHGFVQAKNYNDEEKYTSGSLILDEYRLPKKAQISNAYSQGASYGNKGYVADAYQGNSYKNINSDYQDSGAYVHDPSGDFGIPYKHVDSPAVPYNHDDAAYKHTNDYNDFDRSVEGGKYIDFNSGQYAHENAGSYVTNNGYKVDYSGAYRNDDSGKYVAGVYRGDEGAYTGYTSGKLGFASNNQYNGYSNGEYLSGTKAFTGASHTLAAGAVNVGLVGKTTLVDDLNENYEANSFGGAHYYDRGVLISHDGSEVRNGNNAAYVTTPTTSGIPTTATPIAVTTAIPVTYKTSYVRVPPKTSVKEIFGYSQPAITHVQSAIVPIKHVTPEVDITGYNQAIDYQLYSQNNKAAIKAEGYDYPKPTIKFEDGNTYTTAAPAFNTAIKFDEGINTHVVSPTVSTLTQSFSHEIHDYVPRVAVEEPFKKVIAYTTGSPAAANAFSHQTIHNVEHNINADVNNGYKYSAPTVVNTQAYNHAFHESDKGYEYKKLLEQTPLVSTTYKPQTFNHEFVHHQQEISHGNTYTPSVQISENSGYSTPEIKYEQTPVVSTTYRPRVNNHQVVHHQQQEVSYVNTYTPSVQIAETSGYEYKKPEIKFEQTPVVSTTYKPQIFNHQVIHQQTQVQHTPSVQITDNSGYQYSTPEIKYEQTPIVSTTYKPQIFNHQVVQQHEVNHINTYSPSVELSQASGYEYKKPEIKFEQTPVVSTTYRPRAFHHQVVHQQQDFSHVNTYGASENSGYQYSTPEIKYEQTPVVSSTYKPQIINHQVIHKQEYSPAHQVSKDYDFKTGYEYSKPTIKFEQTPKTLEYTTAQPAIYKSNAHSHQTIHNVQQKYHVASTPESYLEQPSVTVYENPLVQFGQKITPAVTFNPIVQQHAINHVNQNLYSYPEIQKNVQTFDAGLSHTRTSHIHHAGASRNENKDAVFVSTTPSQLIYEDHYVDYETPEKINTYNAPAYIPPKSEYASVSTVSPLSTSEQERYYKELQYESQKVVPIQQVQFLTTHEQTKLKSINFEPQITSTYKPIQYTPQIQVDYKADEYLPPVVSTSKPVITTFKQTYLPPISTTSAPKFTPEYLPPKVDYLPPSTTAKPFFKSTTESTYKAPEYLPPLSEEEPKVVNFESFNVNNYDTDANIKYNPYQDFNNEGVVASTTFAPKRKQNIVVETAKSNLLGFGTVGPDAGLVSPAYIPVTSTYAPSKQEFFEVTPSATPIRRTKPKVAVVTKINDFNPLLVRKLGAVCSCQSPVLVLKGKRPVNQQEYVDYDADDYDDVGRGDIGSTPRAAAIKSFDSKHVTPVPIVSSSFNPIIVPDDSFYQDYLESDKPKELYSESFVSPTPVAVSSSTERIVKIRPRVKAVTAAPTYNTVLIKESVTPAVVIKNAEGIESQSFDRYGPGGWRSRDETLQGSVDCQRAGLFRHPKQCNKFYACRWDCTKQRFTLHVFNCPVQLSFDPSIGACNWPSQGPACQGDTLLTNAL